MTASCCCTSPAGLFCVIFRRRWGSPVAEVGWVLFPGEEGDRMDMWDLPETVQVGQTMAGKLAALCFLAAPVRPFGLFYDGWRLLWWQLFAWVCSWQWWKSIGGGGVVGDDLGWPDGGCEDGRLLQLRKSGRGLPKGFPARVDVAGGGSLSGCIGGTPMSAPVG